MQSFDIRIGIAFCFVNFVAEKLVLFPADLADFCRFSFTTKKNLRIKSVIQTKKLFVNNSITTSHQIQTDFTTLLPNNPPISTFFRISSSKFQ